MKMEQKIGQFIDKFHMLPIGSGVVVGLSGGADSVALLDVLCHFRAERKLKLIAVHVHHGIRPEADRDVMFCSQLCKERGVEFFCEYVDVPKLAEAAGISEEEAGRNARYEIFEQYRLEHSMNVVAVAHHQNDQAETMLFQLFRGSGLRGLTGMQPKREAIIRPLLCVSREEIEEYLREKNIRYVTDATNEEDIYSRNKIRHYVLPIAEEISSGAAEHMSKSAAQLREVLEYMELQAADFLKKHGVFSGEEMILPVKELKKEHVALQKMIVTEVIGEVFENRKDITEKHVNAVLELLEKSGEKSIQLPKSGKVLKQYDELIFRKDSICREYEGNKISKIVIEPDKTYILEDGTILKTKLILCNNLENIPKNNCVKWFDYDKISETLFLRTREQGDYLTVRDDGARKPLKDYLINEKVPKSERDKQLLLADGNHIVWVLGKRISAHYKVTEKTKRILQVNVGGNDCG